MNSQTAPVLDHVNAMPAPTWHRLSMNSATVDIPAHFARAHRADIRCDLNLIAHNDAFGEALDALQLDTYGTEKAAYSYEMAEALVRRESEPAVATTGEELLDATALSPFQIQAQAMESVRSVAAAFETGMGPVAEGFLHSVAGTPVVLATSPGERNAEASVHVFGIDRTVNACALDLVVAEGSELTVALTFSAPEAMRCAVGSLLRVFVGRDAVLNLVVTQAMGSEALVLDDLGAVLDCGAKLNVRQSVLGGSQAFCGLATDLRGDGSAVNVETRYIGTGSQERDFNYVMRHRGAHTASRMDANGVLAGQSIKTLRGTIDFVRGCVGAEGSEVETVLLASEKAVNRSVPVILCGEDDVAGNHGATIGSMNDEQLFYLQSRGLSPEAAEAMMLRASVEAAYLNAVDDFGRQAVQTYGTRRFIGFEPGISEN